MLIVRPITIRLATRLTKETHRREPSLTGALWACGLVDDDGPVLGCAVIGCPKARMLDGAADRPKETLEIVRCAVPPGIRQNGHGGAPGMLYQACSRAARNMGALNLLTYTHADEPGTSLKAIGWVRESQDGTPVVFGGGDWSRPSRPRAKRVEIGPKHRWWAPWSEYLKQPKERAA